MTIKGQSCAVTGAGGFIGRALCARLVSEGARVRGLDLDPMAYAATKARLQEDMLPRLRSVIDKEFPVRQQWR